MAQEKHRVPNMWALLGGCFFSFAKDIVLLDRFVFSAASICSKKSGETKAAPTEALGVSGLEHRAEGLSTDMLNLNARP